MKKILLCAVFLAALMSVPALAGELTMRGCWVSTVYNLDYPSASGLSAAQLAAEADAIVARAKELGMNALFLQVRPCGDALYPSKIFPWSAYLSGTQGTAPDEKFDPLGYFLKICHQNGIKLHAWINPYRLTRTKAATKQEALAQLYANHPARSMADSLLFSDGCLYLDPGQPKSRELILSGVRELLQNYDLDGVHLDDYFYPTGSFDDSATVSAFGSSYTGEADFRRASVDELIAGLQSLTHEVRPQAEFGVAPSGIWANAAQMAGGSNTIGGSSYLSSYADSRKWVREGLVDYIMPQLYWSIGNKEGEFQSLLDWWCETVKDTKVKLYIGLAAYRTSDAAEGDVWYGSAEVLRELDAIETSSAASGAVLFRFGSVSSSQALSKDVGARFRTQRDKYKLLRETVAIGLTLVNPARTQYIAAGNALGVSCTAAPCSHVEIWDRDKRTPLSARPDGSYIGNVILPIPDENESVKPAALLCTAERNGFVWVKLFNFTITSVTVGKPLTLTNISGSEQKNGHLVLLETNSPCAINLEPSGDALRLTVFPVQTAALFEDSFFSDIRVTSSNNESVYTLTLPESCDHYSFSIAWEESRIGIWIRRLDG